MSGGAGPLERQRVRPGPPPASPRPPPGPPRAPPGRPPPGRASGPAPFASLPSGLAVSGAGPLREALSTRGSLPQGGRVSRGRAWPAGGCVSESPRTSRLWDGAASRCGERGGRRGPVSLFSAAFWAWGTGWGGGAPGEALPGKPLSRPCSRRKHPGRRGEGLWCGGLSCPRQRWGKGANTPTPAGVSQPPCPSSSVPFRRDQRGAAARLEEWDTVEEIQSGLGAPSAAAVPPISFNEALQYFQTADLSECRKKVRGAAGRRGLAALLRFLFGPPRLQPQLQGEWELALAMAQCGLDNKEWVHMRILQTIYKKLTRSKLGCPRYGAHWEELGFQGSDPSTDLRGTGMLALMQMLFFVMDSQMLPLAREIFHLSQHETQNFPFSIMSVNITHIVLQALREGRLSRECNRRRQVMAVLNELYAAAFLQLYRVWKQQHKTIADSGFLLKELELSTKKKPRQLLKSLEAYMNRSPASDALQLPSSSSGSEEINFTGICDLQVELEGESQQS